MLALVLLCILSLAAVPCNGLSCPCWRQWPRPKIPPPTNCRGGLVADICGCYKVCAKVEGESCGGYTDMEGKCDAGLYCAVIGSERPSGRERPGRCIKKSNNHCLDFNYHWHCAPNAFGMNCTKDWFKDHCPLTCGVKPKCEERLRTQLQVKMYTSDIANAGTTGIVFLQIFGSMGQTRVLHLSGPGYNQRGKMDAHTFDIVNVGTITKIKLSLSSKDDWHPKKMEVFYNGHWIVLNINNWLTSGKIVVFPVRGGPRPTPDYVPRDTRLHLKMYTSDIANAGTTDIVSLQIFGTLGQTRVLYLNGPGNNQRGKMDTHTFFTRDVGVIKKIQLSLLSNDDWHPRKMELFTNGQKMVLNINDWLTAGKIFVISVRGGPRPTPDYAPLDPCFTPSSEECKRHREMWRNG